MSGTLVIALKLVVAAIVCWFLIHHNYMSIIALPSAFFSPFFAMAFFLSLTTLTISIWRFWFLINIFTSLSFFQIGKIVWASTFLNTFVPSGISGDVYKAIKLKNHITSSKLAVLIIFDKLIGLYALIFIGAVLAPFSHSTHASFLLMSCGLTVGGACAFFLANPIGKFFEVKLPKLSNIFFIVHSLKLQAAKTLIISIFAHLVGGVSIYFLLLSINMPPPNLITMYSITPYALIVSAFPILPGGIGSGHVAFAYVFNTVGYSKGADIFTLYLFLQCSIAALGSFFVGERLKPEE